MRRSYISPEYRGQKIFGTYNMVEEANYFGSKMLEIEDILYLESQSLIYYQKSNGEQIDLSVESSLTSFNYTAPNSKQTYQTLKLDEKQSTFQKDNNTSWILEIDLKSILEDFLFATMKRYRTFEGLRNNMTKSNDVNTAVVDYIRNNVTNRYKFRRIDLFIEFKDLRNQNVLRWKNTWNPNANKNENKFTKFQSDTAFDDSSIKIQFNQEKTSKSFTFDYYYNVLFEKL